MSSTVETIIPDVPSQNAPYTASVTGWVQEALKEGEAFLKEEWGYRDIDKYLAYLMEGTDVTSPVKPAHLANFPINRAAKAVADTISALSDTRLISSFSCANPLYAAQAQIFNKLIKYWWLSEDVDLRIGEVTSWAATAGTGYGNLDYNRDRQELELQALDPRDLIPIRPSSRGNLNDCMGVIRRIPVTVNALRSRYPEKASQISPDYEGSFLRQRIRRLSQAASSVMDRVQGRTSTADMNIPMVNVYFCQLRDIRRNETSQPIQVGDPQTNWGYEVQPGAPLYPRGRWILCTSRVVLDDVPNPHWHGRFTTIKLNLDPYPWSWFGKSVLADLIPINDLLNELISKVVQAARKTLQPGIIADKNAVPDSVLKNLDTSRPGMRLKVNSVLGEGIKLTDPVIVPPYIMDIIRMCMEQVDDLAGTRGLSELMNLAQMPSADTLEKLQAAMTPAIKRRGRQLEAFLREMAEMLKLDMMQFYSMPRRIQMLGPEGAALEDFDYQPGTLVPAPVENDPRSEAERAAEHAKNFPFFVQPGSLLQLAQDRETLEYMRLRQMGCMDMQSLLEKIGVPNIPQVLERLSAEMQMMAGMAAGGGAGRPPTFNAPPSLQQKGDGRVVQAES